MTINDTFNRYKDAERSLINEIILDPEYITKTTQECINIGFTLFNPLDNRNDRSNYEYAEEFFKWLISGEKQLSKQLIELNPWVKRFVDSTGLPDNFSSSYAWKIKSQIKTILNELVLNNESRRAYINILYPTDQIILDIKTTHEFPCTIGLQLFIRNNFLHMIVNMRSNNVYAVMPYDVYNFTMLQSYLAEKINAKLGIYYHQINNAHLYNGDIRRLKEEYGY